MALEGPTRESGGRHYRLNARYQVQPAGLSPAEDPGMKPGFPLARLVAVISLATGAVRDMAIGAYEKETGETALFRTLMDRLRRGDVVLGDRYFASYFGIAMLYPGG